MRVPVRKRLKHDALHDREDGGGDADAKRQRQQRRQADSGLRRNWRSPNLTSDQMVSITPSP